MGETTQKHNRSIALFVGVVVPLLLAMVVAFVLVGCSSDTETESDGETSSSDATAEDEAEDESLEQVDFTFSADSDCGSCHTTQAESLEEDSDCPAAYHSSVSCTTCHSDIDALTEVHEDVEYGDRVATRLKYTEVDTTACVACHGTLEELAETTTDSTVLTDSNGTVVNPHSLPDVEEHESVDCGDCHDMHDSDTIEETAASACLGCHHMGVYECYTCHE